MIVYLSHWDWNLYKSRKDIVEFEKAQNNLKETKDKIYEELKEMRLGIRYSVYPQWRN